LDENLLSGSIPPELGGLTNLTILKLTSNQLTGPIPPELGNLTNLQHFQLFLNQLSGSIPANLANLVNLSTFYLHENQLSGEVPLAVAQLGGQIQQVSEYWSDGCNYNGSQDGLSMPDNPDYRAADLDGDGHICGLGFSGPSPSPATQLLLSWSLRPEIRAIPRNPWW
jgi:hypothetical protein